MIGIVNWTYVFFIKIQTETESEADTGLIIRDWRGIIVSVLGD